MRARTVILFLAVLLLGAIGGSMLTPPAADAVSREIIQIQQTVNEILQNQQDLRTDLDTKVAGMQTLVQQSLDASAHLNQTMGALQKTLQDASANNGANNTSISQQMQGVTDNMQDMGAHPKASAADDGYAEHAAANQCAHFVRADVECAGNVESADE